MGTGPFTEVTLWIDDQMVVSVGPYMFHSSAQRARRSLANSGTSDSPPQKARNCFEPGQPASIKARQVAGVACITVERESRIHFINRTGSRASSRLAITSFPPLIS